MPVISAAPSAPPAARRRASARFAPLAVLAAGVAMLVPGARASAAPAPVELGTAAPFAVLAGTGITNTGPTTITGDVGTSPTPTETGFDQVTLSGANHQADDVALKAKNDLTTAYDDAAGRTPPIAVPNELGRPAVYTPGVYQGASLQITGTMTLDTLGDPSAVFIFRANETLTTATDSSVIVLNGGTACNVFWQLGSSADLGVRSSLIGTVMAGASITAKTGATVQGRLLAETGAVTLDTNTITAAACAASTTPTTAAGGGTTTTAVTGGTPTTIVRGATATTVAQAVTTVVPTVVTRGPSARGGSSGPTATAPSGRTATAESTRSASGVTGSSTATSLPSTGLDARLPIVGAGACTVGLVLLALSGLRRRTT
jgi:type VI secretion system secreted protein VgrG